MELMHLNLSRCILAFTAEHVRMHNLMLNTHFLFEKQKGKVQMS